MASSDLAKLVVSRRWVAAVLGGVAVVATLVGVFLLVTKDREDAAAGGAVPTETESTALPDGAELIDIDDDGENDFIVFNDQLVDLRPDSTVSTAWIAGISAIVSALLTAVVSVMVALLGRHDRDALEELARRIEEYTHSSPAAVTSA